MGFGNLFRSKRSRPKGPEEKVDPVKQEPPQDAKNEVQMEKEPPKFLYANIVYPFHDVKATSFPPPLSVDASVLTEPPKPSAPTTEEASLLKPDEKKHEDKDRQVTEGREEIKESDKKKDDLVEDVCNLRTCPQEDEILDTCTGGRRKKDHLEDRISPTKLTEMINSSIKEAMQDIVKQCRMDDEKMPTGDVDKKTRDDIDRSTCYNKDETPVKIKHIRIECPGKSKYKEEVSSKSKHAKDDAQVKSKHEHRPRTVQDTCVNRSKSFKTTHDGGYKTNQPSMQGRYCPSIRPRSKKLHDETTCVKSQQAKETVCGDSRGKRHSKPSSNVKTDNRRMTGNVNIYICSENTENSQAKSKQKEKSQRPCAETSSETTSQHSTETCPRTASISSSKLITSIRKKRQKSQDQNSLDFLPEKEEIDGKSSDNSCDCTTTAKMPVETMHSDSVDISNVSSENIDVVNSESLSSGKNDCRCKESSFGSTDVGIDKSDLSFDTTRLVVCEDSKTERPWTTIYPSKIMSESMDSEGWSSKSVCGNVDLVECPRNDDYDEEEKRKNIWRTCVDSSDEWIPKSVGRDDRGSYYKNNSKMGFGDHRDRRRDVRGQYCDSSSNDWLLDSICTNTRKGNYKNIENTLSQESRKNSRNGVTNIYKCRCKDKEVKEVCDGDWGVYSNYNVRRRCSRNMQKENTTKQWSTCSCIAEEEEEEDEDYCTNKSNEPKESREITVCQKADIDKKLFVTESKISKEEIINCNVLSKDTKSMENVMSKVSQENTGFFVAEDNKQEKNNEKEDKEIVENNTNVEISKGTDKIEKTKEDNSGRNDQVKAESPPKLQELSRSPKIRKIEERLYKNVSRPPTNVTSSPKATEQKNVSKSSMETKTVPANEPVKSPVDVESEMPKQSDVRRPAIAKRGRPLRKPNLEATKSDEKSKETTEETLEAQDPKKENEKTFQEKLKDSFICRSIRKCVDSMKRRKGQPETSVEKGEDKEPPAVESEKADTDIEKEKSRVRRRPRMMELERDRRRKEVVPDDVSKADKEKDKSSPVKEPPRKSLKDKEEKIVKRTTPRFLRLTADNTSTKVEKLETEKSTGNANEEKPPKPKLLVALAHKRTSLSEARKEGKAEAPKESALQEAPGEPEPQVDTKVQEPREMTKEPVPEESRRTSEVPETTKSSETPRSIVSEKIVDQKRPSKEVDVKKDEFVDGKKEKTTVCVSFDPREVTKEESTKSTASQYGVVESDVCGTYTSTECPNCKEVNDFGAESQEETCRCSYTPVSQCYNDTSRPKSCLKTEKQYSSYDQPKQDFTGHDRCRDWEECNCRKQITCTDCCRPKNECSCSYVVNCKVKDEYRCRKSMFCLYCDNPRDRCACRAPVRRCSYCELSLDLCRCQDQEIFGWDGRPVFTEVDNDRTMYVTAWKPRREVRRYFARNLEDLREDSNEECCCYEKLRPHGSDDLPYQRLSVFSDVMDELQQKMSESMCCTRCRKVPCCCGIVNEGREEKRTYCLSPKTQRKNERMEKSRHRSPTNDRRGTLSIIRVCCACKASPCRCKKNKQTSKKPRAKCFYCKNSPCVCVTARDHNKPRPCRCADSPCRTKEKEVSPRGKISVNQRNNEEKVICVR